MFTGYLRLRKFLIMAFLPLILLSCNSSPQPEVNSSSVEPVLTVVENTVQVVGSSNSPTPFQKDQSVPIHVNETMTADQLGRGLVSITNHMAVDLFRDSEFRITQITPEAGDSLFVGLEQLKGHIRVQTSQNTSTRVRLVTSIATVTTLRPGTDFVICHNPVALSCIVVLSGEVEVVGQDQVVDIKGGEATYVLKDKEPFPPICSHPDEVSAWIDQKVGAGEVGAISKLVASWDPIPCATATQNAIVEPTSASPSSSGMIKIDAGEYIIGVPSPTQDQIYQEQITLQSYWIDQYEVTNGQYQVFMDESGHVPPVVWPGDPDKPVSGVTQGDAIAYCAWAGKRLPTEAEWEVAARGPAPDPPLYPWGNDPLDGGKVNSLPYDSTYPVGAYSFNQSPFGIYDMAGNVWEWVGEPYAPIGDYQQILRGGRYGFIQNMAHREQVDPNDERFIVVAGFRCAADRVTGE